MYSELSKLLNVSEVEIKNYIISISERIKNSGINLIYTDYEAVMVTSPENSDIIDKLQKDELAKDLSKASIETLTIILYRGPMNRSQIDYIRGVNSQFILRNLLVRGLINKYPDPSDDRVWLYSISPECLSHLGLNNSKDAPDFQKINHEIEGFLNTEKEVQNNV